MRATSTTTCAHCSASSRRRRRSSSCRAAARAARAPRCRAARPARLARTPSSARCSCGRRGRSTPMRRPRARCSRYAEPHSKAYPLSDAAEAHSKPCRIHRAVAHRMARRCGWTPVRQAEKEEAHVEDVQAALDRASSLPRRGSRGRLGGWTAKGKAASARISILTSLTGASHTFAESETEAFTQVRGT
eukprot:504947-Prymnesium_polylepis.1